ncbi:MAG: efflux RND transporter periplasmic adaptor subunit [Synergistaceae bacterium]|jgi:multidrug efflux pump subunit AcrA (membrane-fusion protein)|nr:efflux RND transporter periplasmic adaptor subunit [Synergistaceae bacterium]
MNESPKSTAYKIFYAFFVILIAAVWIYAFKLYFRHYDSVHPKITWASPWVQTDIVPVDGLLVWDESVLSSPMDGTVKYPLGTGPVRVPKGATVARVSSGSSASEVKSQREGYFVAGLDGFEESWKYSAIWAAIEKYDPDDVKMFKDGDKVRKGSPIGKLVRQPQILRLVASVYLTEGMRKELSSKTVKVKMDLMDTPSQAEVDVYDPQESGTSAKVLLKVPWFPPQILMSRKYRLLVQTGEISGIAVPEAAVTVREGKQGVYVIKGAESVFTEIIEGRVIDASQFLVISADLKLGDVVIAEAEDAREGSVRLW